MEYMKPFIPLKVTAMCNIRNYTPIDSLSHLASIVFYHHLCSQSMSVNGSPLKTVYTALYGGWFGTQPCHDHNSGLWDKCSWTATGQDSRFGKHTEQYHPQHGYGYPPSQQPFPGAPQFHQQSTFNMTNSAQPTTSARQQYPSYRPQWQVYDLHQGGYGRC